MQAKYDNGTVWRKVGTAVVKANGKYRFVEKPTTDFDRAYRVSKKADTVALADKSRERSVKVFAWNWLSQMETERR